MSTPYTQVSIFSYELLQNIKELKIYQDIFYMDAKPTCHEMRIDRSFSLSSLQTSACLPESCYCSFCRNTKYHLKKFSEYDDSFKVHKFAALWSVWSSERWSHGWHQSHPGWWRAGKVLVLTDHKCVTNILVSFGLVEQQ